MYNFVNSFRLATNEQCTEVIISFNQTFPDDSGAMQPTPVSDLVMPGPLAAELASKLTDIFNGSNAEDEEPKSAE